jgi:predicted ATPase
VALRVRGERRFVVPPLSCAETLASSADRLSAAEALFTERAREAQPLLPLTPANVACIAAICRRLEGIPLAIELAALRVTIFPPSDLLRHLDHRLALLAGGARDLPQRQQTMRNAIAWSYELLTSHQQSVFRRLAVCVGGWTFAAAQALCADVAIDEDLLEILATLIDANLIQRRQDDADEPRYVMLEILREFGLELLAEQEELDHVQRRHAAWVLTLTQEARQLLVGPEQGRWLRRLDQEQGNIHAALDWSRGHDAKLGLSIAAALWRFWYVRRHLREGLSWLKEFLVLAQEQESVREIQARASYGASVLAAHVGEYLQAERLSSLSLHTYERLGDANGMCDVLIAQGNYAYMRDQLTQAEECYRQALSLSRSLEKKGLIAGCLSNLADVAMMREQYDEARKFLEESLIYDRELEDHGGIAINLVNLGNLFCRQEDYAQAIAVSEEALHFGEQASDRSLVAAALDTLGKAATRQRDYQKAYTALEESRLILEELHDMPFLASVLRHLAEVAVAEHAYRQAEAYYQISIKLYQQLETPVGVAKCLAGLATALVEQGQVKQAAHYTGRAAALLETTELSSQASVTVRLERISGALKEILGDEAFHLAWEQGKAMSLEELLMPNEDDSTKQSP